MSIFSWAGKNVRRVTDRVVATPDSLTEFLVSQGAWVARQEDAGGDPVLRANFEGVTFQVFLDDCIDGCDCRSVSFHAGFEVPERALQGTVDDWNRVNRFCKLRRHDRTAFWLGMDVYLGTGGLSLEDSTEVLEIWINGQKRFQNAIGW